MDFLRITLKLPLKCIMVKKDVDGIFLIKLVLLIFKQALLKELKKYASI